MRKPMRELEGPGSFKHLIDSETLHALSRVPKLKGEINSKSWFLDLTLQKEILAFLDEHPEVSKRGYSILTTSQERRIYYSLIEGIGKSDTTAIDHALGYGIFQAPKAVADTISHHNHNNNHRHSIANNANRRSTLSSLTENPLIRNSNLSDLKELLEDDRSHTVIQDMIGGVGESSDEDPDGNSGLDSDTTDPELQFEEKIAPFILFNRKKRVEEFIKHKQEEEFRKQKAAIMTGKRP
eukprot:CAMPEP_0197519942 /NCGR_PEP_ID=MMETSP1318-20131121/5232_1 /TAXON_ID=552666 /ORGANISM="Partenskyella glossopodia, Strain RCC365" /LENGTH=238 /DNA_ID=CAMNT_0043071207 /DNA_START=247 /DNA_END=960 /DNA_ORIENTATION=+